MSRFRKISKEELKKIEFDMLVDLAEFCEKNNIRYFLSSGTLLGAVRHQGFIPWDDDIDVMLPRKDYERFVTTYKHNDYYIDERLVNKNCSGRCGRLKYKKSRIESNIKGKYQERIFIDVFPIDGIESNKLKMNFKLLLIKIFITCHMATVSKFQKTNRYADKNAGLFNWKQHTRNIIKYFLVATVGHTDCRFWVNIINNYLSKCDFETSEYVGFLAGGYYGSKEVMPREVFESAVKVKFEGREFNAPVGYDYYLTKLYGDYMTPPPKDKRNPHHAFKAYVIDEEAGD